MNMHRQILYFFLLAMSIIGKDLCAAGATQPVIPSQFPQNAARVLDFAKTARSSTSNAVGSARDIWKNSTNALEKTFDKRILYPLIWGDLDDSFKRLEKNSPALARHAQPFYDAARALFLGTKISGDRSNALTIFAEQQRQALKEVYALIEGKAPLPFKSPSLEVCVTDLEMAAGDVLGINTTVTDLLIDMICAAVRQDSRNPAVRNDFKSVLNDGHVLSFCIEHLVSKDDPFKQGLKKLIDAFDVKALFDGNEKTAEHTLHAFATALQELPLPTTKFLLEELTNAITKSEQTKKYFTGLGALAVQALVVRATPVVNAIIANITILKETIAQAIPYLYDDKAPKEYPNAVDCFYAIRRGESIPQVVIQGPCTENGTQPTPTANTFEAWSVQGRLTSPFDVLMTRLDILWKHIKWRAWGEEPQPNQSFISRLISGAQSIGTNPAAAAAGAPTGTPAQPSTLQLIMGGAFQQALWGLVGINEHGDPICKFNPAASEQPDITAVPREIQDKTSRMLGVATAFLGSGASDDGLREYARIRNLSPEERAEEKLEKKEMKESDVEAERIDREEKEALIREIDEKRNGRINERKWYNQLLFEIPIPRTPIGVGIHVRDVVHSLINLAKVGVLGNFYRDIRNIRTTTLFDRVIKNRDVLLNRVKDIDPRIRAMLAKVEQPARPSVFNFFRAHLTGQAVSMSASYNSSAAKDDSGQPTYLRDNRPKYTGLDYWKHLFGFGEERKLNPIDTTPLDALREEVDKLSSVISLNPFQKQVAIAIGKKVLLSEATDYIAKKAAGPTILGPEMLSSYTKGSSGVLEPVTWTDPTTGKTHNKIILSPFTSGKRIADYVSKEGVAALGGAGVVARLFQAANQNGGRGQMPSRDEFMRYSEHAIDEVNRAMEHLTIVNTAPVLDEAMREAAKTTLDAFDSDALVDMYDQIQDDHANDDEEPAENMFVSIGKDLVRMFAFGDSLSGKIQEHIIDSEVVQHATKYWMYVVAAHVYDKLAAQTLKTYTLKTLNEFQELLEAHQRADRTKSQNPAALVEAEDALKKYLNASLAEVGFDTILNACVSRPAVMGTNLTLGLIATRLAVMCGKNAYNGRKSPESAIPWGIGATICALTAYRNGKNLYQAFIDTI